jgi:hypothetical protein
MTKFPSQLSIWFGCSSTGRINYFLGLFISANLLLTLPALAAVNNVTDEDRSRFVERMYEKTEPGLKSPAEYIEIAKKAVHSQYGAHVPLSTLSDGMVTYRTYRNAPKADRDIICVSFVYKAQMGGGGIIGTGFITSNAAPARPIVLALIRRDLSKIYVNIVHFLRK